MFNLCLYIAVSKQIQTSEVITGRQKAVGYMIWKLYM